MPEWLLQTAAIVGAGVGAYTAIRADLARLDAQVKQAIKTADEAHRRIDHFAERRQA